MKRHSEHPKVQKSFSNLKFRILTDFNLFLLCVLEICAQIRPMLMMMMLDDVEGARASQHSMGIVESDEERWRDANKK